jgi:hypothetical protein
VIRICTLFVVVAVSLSTPLPMEAAGEAVTPPAIYLPFDAKIRTEISFSDSDVLGMVKQILPTLGDLVKQAVAAGAIAPLKSLPVPAEAVAKIDLKPLATALEGITNVRVIVATYKPGLAGGNVTALFDTGAAKAGGFTKIAADFSLAPRTVAVYSQPGGAGFLLYVYDASGGTITAIRLSGQIDVARLVSWVGDAMKLFQPCISPTPQPETQPAPGGEAP